MEEDQIFRQENESLDHIEKFRYLVRMHHDIWDEELLSEIFAYEYKLLYPKERAILELCIEGMPVEEIAKIRRNKIGTIERVIRDIKYKYRNGIKARVDNIAFKFQRVKKYASNYKKSKRDVETRFDDAAEDNGGEY